MTRITFVDSNNQVAYSYNLIKHEMKPNIRIMITKENNEILGNSKIYFIHGIYDISSTININDSDFGNNNYCIVEIPNSLYTNKGIIVGKSHIQATFTDLNSNQELIVASIYSMNFSLQESITYITAKLSDKLENRGITLTGEEGLVSLIHKVKEIPKTVQSSIFYDEGVTGNVNTNYVKSRTGVNAVVSSSGTTVSSSTYADCYYIANVLLPNDWITEFTIVSVSAFGGIAFINSNTQFQWSVEYNTGSSPKGLEWRDGSITEWISYDYTMPSTIKLKKQGTSLKIYLNNALIVTKTITDMNGYLAWKTHSHSNRSVTFKKFKVEELYFIDEDASVDHSSTLFGNHISLRNEGTATVGYDSNGYYTLTNTTNNAECFVELPQLQGIYDKSFKVTVRSKCETSNKCPVALYYYINDNNWGGVKDETTTLWTSAKTNGVFTENSIQTGNASNIEVVTEFLYNATDKTLTVKDFVNGTLKSSKSMSIPITLDPTVKWGTSTTWGTNATRKVYEIKAEYTLLYAPVLDGSEDITLIQKDANGTSINYPITINNNELVTGCGYLSDGWSNEGDWQLNFEYYSTGDNNGYIVIPKGTDRRDYNGIQQWYNSQLNFYVQGAKPSGNITNATVLNQWVNVKITKEGYIWKVYYNDVLKTTFDLSSYASIVDNWAVMCIGLDKNESRNSAKIRNIKVEAI